jgi:hypothetical protein
VKVFAVIPVLLVILISLCGSPVPPPATRTVAPTPTASRTPQPTGIIANTFDDAVRLSTPIFNIHGSKMHFAHVDTASYVETTVGQARAMFEPTRPFNPGDWGAPESSPVWVIVAYGQFRPMAISDPDPGTGVLTTAWAAVEEGGIGAQNGYSSQQYDLSQLGTPHELDPAILNSAD